MTVRIWAEITVAASQMQSLNNIMAPLVQQSRQDHGCLQYDVFKKNDGFVFIEHWQDEAALKAHEASAHFQQFKQAVTAADAQLRVEVLSEFLSTTH